MNSTLFSYFRTKGQTEVAEYRFVSYFMNK